MLVEIIACLRKPDLDLNVRFGAGGLNALDEPLVESIGFVRQYNDAFGARNSLFEQLQVLWIGGWAANPGDISARVRQAFDKSSSHRIRNLAQYDRRLARGGLCR